MQSGRSLVCGVVLEVLYRGIRVLTKVDTRIHEELLALPQGKTIRFSVSPAENSPKLSFVVSDGTIHKSKAQPDIEITFKNEKMAFRVFTGRMGIAGAYAAHAFSLRGNINETMGVVRIVDLVESYLFPKFLTRHILKEIPKKQYPTALVYLRLIPGV
jgi:hypothetical protein